MSTFLNILEQVLEILAIPLELAVLTLVYWMILRALRHTRSIQTLGGIVVISFVVSTLTRVLKLPALSVMANGLLNFMPLVILVLFSEEIRRLLSHPAVFLSRWYMGIRARRNLSRQKEQVEAGVDEVVKSVCCLTPHPLWRNYLQERYHLDMEEERLSRGTTGALLAIGGVTGLDEFRETGVELDCAMNYRLLRTIFYSGTALHDGGVILNMSRNGLRITAAGCRFPQGRAMGDGPVHTRQNAVRGMAERTDAFVLMVSEETGSVLMPDADDRMRIHRLASPGELREALLAFFKTHLMRSGIPSERPVEDSSKEEVPAE
ncbi:MAG: diadenylate cyclase [Oligosphaeraceae bacterium]